jgi:hypothetical protein
MATQLETPVALTLFNRPTETLRVFNTIREAKPLKLFLISDIGRNKQEELQCIETRNLIESRIDWPCEVFKNYAEKNMGPKLRLSTGVTWVFEHVDRAIIFEHDCLPSQDFFRFCDELLEKYKNDERIMHISGNNFQQKNSKFLCNESYYFSHIPHIWGFATWARAWKHYDVNVSNWPQIKESEYLKTIFHDPAVRDRWEYRFAQYYRQEVASWDGQWVFACLINNGLSINPKVNLVSNIGFDDKAFTTKNPDHRFSQMPIEAIQFPLIHPEIISVSQQADAYTYKYVFEINNTYIRNIFSFIKFRLPFLYNMLRILASFSRLRKSG